VFPQNHWVLERDFSDSPVHFPQLVNVFPHLRSRCSNAKISLPRDVFSLSVRLSFLSPLFPAYLSPDSFPYPRPNFLNDLPPFPLPWSFPTHPFSSPKIGCSMRVFVSTPRREHPPPLLYPIFHSLTGCSSLPIT